MKTKVTKQGDRLELIVFGQEFPKHLQTAYGRYIFRLLHNYKGLKHSIWLRDMPLSLFDLAYNGSKWAIASYLAECQRKGVKRIS
jgi:hypothetical protein